MPYISPVFSFYIRSLTICAQSFLTRITTLTDQESHTHLILSQLLGNNDNNVNTNNTPRKHTAQLPVRHSKTIILKIPFAV